MDTDPKHYFYTYRNSTYSNYLLNTNLFVIPDLGLEQDPAILNAENLFNPDLNF